MSQDNPAGEGAQNPLDAARAAQSVGRSGPIIAVTLVVVVLLVSSFVIWRLHQLRARIHAGERSAPGTVPSQLRR